MGCGVSAPALGLDGVGGGAGAGRPQERPADARMRDAGPAGARGTEGGGAGVGHFPAWGGVKGKPDHSSKEQTALNQYLKGNAYLEKQELGKAVAAFTMSIDYNPKGFRAYHERGVAHAQLEDYAAAVRDFDRVVELKPEWGIAYVSRAEAHTRLEHFELAVEDCSKAVALMPEEAKVFRARAEAYQGLGETDKAMDDFEKAGELEEKRTCIICLDEPRNTRLHPCFHAVMCSTCAKECVEKDFPCPLCGQKVERIEVGEFTTTFSVDEIRKVIKEAETLVKAEATLQGISEIESEAEIQPATPDPATPAGPLAGPPAALERQPVIIAAA